MAQVTIAQLEAALNEVKRVVAQKGLNATDFENDTPVFANVIDLIVMEGLQGANSIDEQANTVVNMLEAALQPIPRVITDIHNERVAVSRDGKDKRYCIFNAMGMLDIKGSSERALHIKMNEIRDEVRDEMVAAAVDLVAVKLAAGQKRAAP